LKRDAFIFAYKTMVYPHLNPEISIFERYLLRKARINNFYKFIRPFHFLKKKSKFTLAYKLKKFIYKLFKKKYKSKRLILPSFSPRDPKEFRSLKKARPFVKKVFKDAFLTKLLKNFETKEDNMSEIYPEKLVNRLSETESTLLKPKRLSFLSKLAKEKFHKKKLLRDLHFRPFGRWRWTHQPQRIGQVTDEPKTLCQGYSSILRQRRKLLSPKMRLLRKRSSKKNYSFSIEKREKNQTTTLVSFIYFIRNFFRIKSNFKC